jgi:mannose-6-phosphate isomerase-like protein (cupin superfamily)
MKQPKITSEGINHKAIDLGKLDELKQYSFNHPVRKTVVEGKIFTGELLHSTGAEISFTSLPPHTGHPFMHAHRKHEEIYIVIRGSGQFQVDEAVFDIREGSVIRVNPEGSRTYRNNSDEPMIFICLQTMAGSLDNQAISDGYRSEGTMAWGKEEIV